MQFPGGNDARSTRPLTSRKQRAIPASTCSMLLLLALRTHPASGVPLDMGPLAMVMPQVAHAPAPAWVKPGLRLVYAGGTATIDGLNPTGPHLSSTNPAGRWNRLAAMGAAGMTQYDIIAVEDGVVVVTMSLYIQPNGLGTTPQLSSTSTILGAPGATSEIWINPSVLSKFHSPGKEITVMKMPYHLGDRDVPSIWIKTNTDAGYELHVYEAATGMLIHFGMDQAGLHGTTKATGDLREHRLIKTPWAGHYSLPASVLTGDFRYTGAISTALPGSFPMRIPLSVSFSPKYHGTGWITEAQTIVQQNVAGLPPSTTHAVIAAGPGQLTNLWLPPQDLERLQEGQELDRDPITQVVTNVGGHQQMPDGSDLLMISHVCPVQRLDFGYSTRTGILVYMSRTDQIGPATMQTQIRLVQ
jgi:hypothetical protein